MVETPSSGSVPCVGCGALVSASNGPTHDYIGASPGCWALYGEMLGRVYGDYRYARGSSNATDAYAAQHPGVPGRRSTQSVAVHLIALHLALEKRETPDRVMQAMQRATQRSEGFVWLEPPTPIGAVTVLDVLEAEGPQEHADGVRRWAESVWGAWSPHHETVRRWASR